LFYLLDLAQAALQEQKRLEQLELGQLSLEGLVLLLVWLARVLALQMESGSFVVELPLASYSQW
jgi:hypothetical protein